jgi:hypothetical protein
VSAVDPLAARPYSFETAAARLDKCVVGVLERWDDTSRVIGWWFPWWVPRLSQRLMLSFDSGNGSKNSYMMWSVGDKCTGHR